MLLATRDGTVGGSPSFIVFAAVVVPLVAVVAVFIAETLTM